LHLVEWTILAVINWVCFWPYVLSLAATSGCQIGYMDHTLTIPEVIIWLF
jgi:hypothetical protein